MFGINNTGKVQLYNVTARFEADSIKTEETYVGNIKPGETGNVDTMLTGVAATMDEKALFPLPFLMRMKTETSAQ